MFGCILPGCQSIGNIVYRFVKKVVQLLHLTSLISKAVSVWSSIARSSVFGSLISYRLTHESKIDI